MWGGIVRTKKIQVQGSWTINISTSLGCVFFFSFHTRLIWRVFPRPGRKTPPPPCWFRLSKPSYPRHDPAISARKPPCFTQGLVRIVGTFHLTSKYVYTHTGTVWTRDPQTPYSPSPHLLQSVNEVSYNFMLGFSFSHRLFHRNGAHLVSISTYMSSQRRGEGEKRGGLKEEGEGCVYIKGSLNFKEWLRLSVKISLSFIISPNPSHICFHGTGQLPLSQRLKGNL